MESTEDWLARIGSLEALEKRVALRLSGKINAPIARKVSFADMARFKMHGRAHSLHCQCDICVPPWLKEEMKSWPKVTKGMYEAHPEAVPVTVIKHKTKPPKPRKSKWTNKGRSGN